MEEGRGLALLRREMGEALFFLINYLLNERIYLIYLSTTEDPGWRVIN